MNNTFVRMFLAVCFFGALQADAWTTTQDAANRMGASQVKEISFEKSATGMSEKQKEEIRAAVNEAAQKGKIDEVRVLAWSDKEYPAEKGMQNKADNELAKKRAQEMEKFLKKDMKVSTVKTYNMSERPNALETFLNTSDAKVKETAENAGAAPTEGNTGIFDMKAQASKGVVMIFMRR